MDPVVRIARWNTPSAKLAKGCGSTTIIGLAAIRAETGNRWEKMRESIASRLEQLLRQRLSPSDFFLPIDDTSYLVVMPVSTPEDGQISCLRIAYELHTSLLGPCSIEHLDVAPAEAVEDGVLEMRPLDRAEMIQLVKKAELVLAPSSQEGGDYELQRRPAPSAPPAGPDVKYLPVWDAQYQVIRAYRCETSEPRYLGVDTSISHSRELARSASAMLYKAVDTLETHLSRGERFILIVPVSYEILSSPVARMEFFSLCRQLPGELRPYLGYMIDDMPVGVPQSRLVDLVSSLRGFSNFVTANVACHQSTSLLAAYRGVGLKALGINLKTLLSYEFAREITRLVTETKRLGLSTFVDGVANTDVLRIVLESGVQWMTGRAIGAAVEEPGPLRRLSTAQLLRGFVYL